MNKQTVYCGFVVITGRSNVGKSTLFNRLLSKKISITSHKPHTTHYNIMGVRTDWPYQAIYVDTPGLYILEKKINRLTTFADIDFISNLALVIFVVESTHWKKEDNLVINKLRNVSFPVLLVINKIDNISEKKWLIPHIQFLSKKMLFYGIVPICAKSGVNVNTLINLVHKALPESKHHFSKNYITDRSQRFIASEIIREKLMRFLGDELPYSVKVKIENFSDNNRKGFDIHGLVLVKKDSQKKIVIGKKAIKIKSIGIKARQDMEVMFKKQVNLKLWVKTQSNWSDDKRSQHDLYYSDKTFTYF